MEHFLHVVQCSSGHAEKILGEEWSMSEKRSPSTTSIDALLYLEDDYQILHYDLISTKSFPKMHRQTCFSDSIGAVIGRRMLQ